MIMKTTSIILLAVCLAACAGSKASRSSAAAGYCPAGSVKVCTSLFEPSKERIPSCAYSELISSR
jgi:hypothetical protein